jgi:trigger factor
MTTSEVDNDVLENDVEPLKLEIKVDEPSSCQRHVTVSISREDIDRYLDTAVGEFMQEASVPGFRPGRAPKKLVSSHFKNELNDKMKGTLLLDAMTQVSEEQDFSAISEPSFDFEAVEIPDEGPLTFEFDIEVRPEFEMPKWKGLKIEKPAMDIGKKEIDGHMAKLLSRHSALEPVAEKATEDDYAVVNMTFTHDGKKISTLNEETIKIRKTLSFRDGNLEGFDKLIVGAKAGDKKESKVVVSQDAETEAVRGQEVDVKVELLDVKRMTLPELDEQMLKQIGDFENEGDLRDAVKSELERQLNYRQHQRIRQQITDLLTESASWDLPPDLLKRQASRELERSVMELRSSGFSDEQIMAHVNTLRQNSAKTTATALKEHFILERIAEEEDIEASDGDYDAELQMMALQSGDSPRSVRSRIEKRGLMDALRNQIVERKVIDLITENATIKEIPHKQTEESTSAVDFAIGGKAASEIPDAEHGGEERELPKAVDHT